MSFCSCSCLQAAAGQSLKTRYNHASPQHFVATMHFGRQDTVCHMYSIKTLSLYTYLYISDPSQGTCVVTNCTALYAGQSAMHDTCTMVGVRPHAPRLCCTQDYVMYDKFLHTNCTVYKLCDDHSAGEGPHERSFAVCGAVCCCRTSQPGYSAVGQKSHCSAQALPAVRSLARCLPPDTQSQLHLAGSVCLKLSSM